jgi:magnesium transporter
MAYQQLTGSRVTWINITNITPDDVEQIRRAFPYIHPLTLEDMLSPIERPKIDDDDDYIFVVAHFPLWDPVSRLTRASEVDFLVSKNYIITIHDGVLKPLTQLAAAIEVNETERQSLLGRSSSHAFYVMLDRLVDYVFPILRKVDVHIRSIEEAIFSATEDVLIRDIALVRRDIIAQRRIIRHLVPILDNLERKERPIIHEDLDEYFGDILDHLQRARDIIDEDAEIMSGLAETADTLISHRINGVIRILTVFSVIMLPLTFLTGVYGMNIDLPLAEHNSAFLIVVSVMVAVVVVMLTYFRYRKWL